jgi:hypothetical protein
VRGHLLSSASSATAGSCQELNCGGRWRECAHAELRGPGWAAALAVSRDQQRGLGRLALGRVRSWVPPRRPGPGGRYLFPVGLGVQPRGPRRASHRLLFLGCPLPWRIQILPESFPTLAGIARSPGPASRVSQGARKGCGACGRGPGGGVGPVGTWRKLGGLALRGRGWREGPGVG